MNEEYERQMAARIVEPLTRVIDQSLQHVIYYVLQGDYPDFNVDAPNTSGGCQGVHLTFSEGEVEFDWDWQSALIPRRDDFDSPGIAYHLVARSTSERQGTVQVPTEEDYACLLALDATNAASWRALQGEPLQAVTVGGAPLADGRYSPQAVQLSFPSAQVVVAIGMSDPLNIGDGDEVLVFADTAWPLRLTDWHLPLVDIWSSIG